MAIRNSHPNMESLAWKTMREALGLKREPEAESDGGQEARPPRTEHPAETTAARPSSPNGDGKQQHQKPESATAGIEGLRLLSEVIPEPLKWLWPGYIPLGELTIVEGHPATNKSSLMNDIAARLTKGEKMPCVSAKASRPRKGGVLILVGEDSVAKTVHSRLEAAGADLARVAVLDDIAIPDDMDKLKKAIRESGARLVVVDTLNDFTNCNVLSNQQVRRALRPLRDLAEELNIAIVLLRHFVKSSSGRSLLRGGGSVGITAMARSQLKVFKHPDDPNLRVVCQDKSNLGPLSPSLLFEVVPDGGKTFHLECHGKCDLTIADLEQKHKGCPTLEAAEPFLLEKLADGKKEVNWLVGQSRGICSKRTLDEAKRNLKIKTVREGKGRDHEVYWIL